MGGVPSGERDGASGDKEAQAPTTSGGDTTQSEATEYSRAAAILGLGFSRVLQAFGIVAALTYAMGYADVIAPVAPYFPTIPIGASDLLAAGVPALLRYAIPVAFAFVLWAELPPPPVDASISLRLRTLPSRLMSKRTRGGVAFVVVWGAALASLGLAGHASVALAMALSLVVVPFIVILLDLFDGVPSLKAIGKDIEHLTRVKDRLEAIKNAHHTRMRELHDELSALAPENLNERDEITRLRLRLETSSAKVMSEHSETAEMTHDLLARLRRLPLVEPALGVLGVVVTGLFCLGAAIALAVLVSPPIYPTATVTMSDSTIVEAHIVALDQELVYAFEGGETPIILRTDDVKRISYVGRSVPRRLEERTILAAIHRARAGLGVDGPSEP